MGKKIIHITSLELSNLISEATRHTIQEMDGKTYSRLYNASHKAKEENQVGNTSSVRVVHKADGTRRFIGSNNDDTISRATQMQDEVQEHWLDEFIGKTFKFYGEDRMGLIAHVLFTFEKVKKLEYNKTILVGIVTFNQSQISGDGIIVDFAKNKVQYHEKGNRYAYNLEIDNRCAPLWNKLLGQLQQALDSRAK